MVKIKVAIVSRLDLQISVLGLKMSTSRELPYVGGLDKVLRRWMVAFGDQRSDLLKLSELILQGYEYHDAAIMTVKGESNINKPQEQYS